MRVDKKWQFSLTISRFYSLFMILMTQFAISFSLPGGSPEILNMYFLYRGDTAKDILCCNFCLIDDICLFTLYFKLQLSMPRVPCKPLYGNSHLGRIDVIKSGRRSRQPHRSNFENCLKVAPIT